jgi:leader peptidase (prepilin peptidase) / N-methyltransferase
MLGKTVAVAMLVGLLSAMVPALVLFATMGMGARKVKLPFGPFLALGGVVALFAGDPLLHAYWSLVH